MGHLIRVLRVSVWGKHRALSGPGLPVAARARGKGFRAFRPRQVRGFRVRPQCLDQSESRWVSRCQ